MTQASLGAAVAVAASTRPQARWALLLGALAGAAPDLDVLIRIGINMPTVFAWTADLAQEGRIALALGTMLMSLEIGIGAGAVLSGMYFQGDVTHIKELYYMASVAAALTGIALIPPFLRGRKS